MLCSLPTFSIKNWRIFFNLWYVNTIHVLARQTACIFCYRAIQTKGKLLFLYRQNNQRRGCYKVGGHYAFYALFVLTEKNIAFNLI